MSKTELPEYCPKCNTQMTNQRRPLHIRDTYVGVFDAMACPVCSYYYFTDMEYDLAILEAARFGLISHPPLERTITILTTNYPASIISFSGYSGLSVSELGSVSNTVQMYLTQPANILVPVTVEFTLEEDLSDPSTY
jgi:hypothetical protein